MVERVDLADPDCEPTDAQLTELSVRAFRGVRGAREAASRRIRAEIAKARDAALRRLQAPPDQARDPA